MTVVRDRATSSAAPALPTTTAPGRSSARGASFRPDIQGLRAVAITAVVLDHVAGWPSGGFVGVDVFFVISGFLITGVLLREWSRSGRISIRDFYVRRLRRIAPAAAVVLVVSIALAAVITPGMAFRRLIEDSVAAAFSLANWRFAATGTDYFAQTGTTSPLQHFWSLAVEEQFYLVWPCLLIVLLAAQSRRGLHKVLVGFVVAGLVGSFVFACWQTAEQPTVAYFSSLTRAWELGAGAAVALLADRLQTLPKRIAWALSRGGVIVIGAALLVVNAGIGFPGPFAALPVVGAVMVVAGGVPGTLPRPWLLTNRLAVFLGAISYSWYLWHFPVLTFVNTIAVPGKRRTLVALAIGLVLAWLSYRLVEQPFLRRGNVHSASRSSAARRAARLRAAIPVAACTAVLVVAGAVLSPAVHAQAVGQVPVPDADLLVSMQKQGTPAARIERDLTAALEASTWPRLDPPASEVEQTGTPAGYDAACSATVIADPTSCSFGDARSRTIVVFGDSLGITLLPTVVEAYGADYHVRGLTLAGCAVADVDVEFGDTAGAEKCRNMRADAIAYVQKTRPALVLMIENSAWDMRLTSGAAGDAAVAEWRAGVERSVAALRRGAEKVAVVGPSIDTGTGIAQCAGPLSSPASCITRPTEAWQVAHRAESTAAGAVYLSTLHWYCVQSYCPSFSGVTPLKRDYVHPTVQYAHAVVADFKVMTRPLLR